MLRLVSEPERKRGQSSLSPPCEDTATRWPSASQEEDPHKRTRVAGTSILDFPVSRTVRNICLLFKLPSLWYFVVAAQ